MCSIYSVINGSVRVFVGEPVTVRQDERVTIDCGNLTIETIRNLTNEAIRNLTNETIHNVTVNPVVTWCKDGREISNGSAINVIISADNRFCIITETLMAVGGQLGTDGDYTCKVCDNNTCINYTSPVEVCGKYQLYLVTVVYVIEVYLNRSTTFYITNC